MSLRILPYLVIYYLLFCNLIVAQKKWPEPKKANYTIKNLSSNGNGYILSDLVFTSKVDLKQPQRDKYAWSARISFISCNIEGYVYNGVTYSKQELIEDFGQNSLSLTDDVRLRSIVVTFNNGKSFKSSSIGNRGFTFSRDLDYDKGDENSDFKIRKISILGGIRNNIHLESKIKFELAKIERLKNNEEVANNMKPKTEENKKAEIDRKPNEGKTNSLATIKSTKKESTDADKKKEEKELLETQKRERKQEATRQKQEKLNAYNKRIENQRKENIAVASSAAASSLGFLYMLGGFLYSNMGFPADDLYTGANFHVNFDVGYGFSAFPIAFDSSVGLEDKSATTIDLRLGLKFGYEMEHGGGNIYGRFEPGFSPIFTDFNYSYGYGAEFFGGDKIIKLYGRYEIGSHNFSSNNWINEDQGEGGKSSTTYQQIRAGLKFSFYRNPRTAKRDHLIIGVMENYFDNDSANRFYHSQDQLDEPLLNIIKVDDPRYIATGYFFEWKRDHTHRLYIELFPNYPVTGEIGSGSGEGKFFIQAGFSRSLEQFFGKN